MFSLAPNTRFGRTHVPTPGARPSYRASPIGRGPPAAGGSRRHGLPSWIAGGSEALAKEREQAPLARGAHALNPLQGAVQLVGPGQRVGATPGAVERPDPVRADDLVRECLAAPVLGQLQFE